MLTPTMTPTTDQPCKTEYVKFGYTVCFILIPPHSFKKIPLLKRCWDLKSPTVTINKITNKMTLSPKKEKL